MALMNGDSYYNITPWKESTYSLLQLLPFCIMSSIKIRISFKLILKIVVTMQNIDIMTKLSKNMIPNKVQDFQATRKTHQNYEATRVTGAWNTCYMQQIY
jgi:hypothetical protein